MASAEHTVTISRPIEDVFAFFSDGTNNPRWRPGVVEISAASNTVGAGAAFSQTLKGPGGRHIPGDYRVTTYEPPTRLEFEVTAGPARPTGTFVLAPNSDQSTTVTFVLALRPRGLMKLMSRMITKQMRNEVACLDNAKRLLESR